MARGLRAGRMRMVAMLIMMVPMITMTTTTTSSTAVLLRPPALGSARALHAGHPDGLLGLSGDRAPSPAVQGGRPTSRLLSGQRLPSKRPAAPGVPAAGRQRALHPEGPGTNEAAPSTRKAEIWRCGLIGLV
ncbi:unnamed protein product [Prorocentrum cordatum]|uniref:Secreted protein n=1 Tax=Prorocentrum cordatum TaxID=2364126 RepID=A0ABN9S3G4_9DINO|nr:unnamed protein product [Polarella glacialis]